MSQSLDPRRNILESENIIFFTLFRDGFEKQLLPWGLVETLATYHKIWRDEAPELPQQWLAAEPRTLLSSKVPSKGAVYLSCGDVWNHGFARICRGQPLNPGDYRYFVFSMYFPYCSMAILSFCTILGDTHISTMILESVNTQTCIDCLDSNREVFLHWSFSYVWIITAIHIGTCWHMLYRGW